MDLESSVPEDKRRPPSSKDKQMRTPQNQEILTMSLSMGLEKSTRILLLLKMLRFYIVPGMKYSLAKLKGLKEPLHHETDVL